MTTNQDAGLPDKNRGDPPQNGGKPGATTELASLSTQDAGRDAGVPGGTEKRNGRNTEVRRPFLIFVK